MLYEILKTSKLGASFAPDIYTALWAQKLARDGEVKTLSGAPPLSFKANGQPLLDYLISGNTVQSSTPTPDNPIMPQGTGERTGNLFDEIYPNLGLGQAVKYKPIFVGDGDFTLSTDYPLVQAGAANLFLLSGNVSSGASTGLNGVYFGQSRTVSSASGYVTIGYRKYSATHPLLSDYHTMLNSGSTALPYEPYGYKIPISSAGQTNNIYLGEVETTRRVKKLVLTGEETIGYDTLGGNSRFTFNNAFQTADYRIGICSHYKYEFVNANNTVYHTSSNTARTIFIFDNRYASAETFKAYLAAQYANGTPVAVWYVLATEETGIVNEPLMKIGEYADTLSMEQAGVQIPTARGMNTLDVLTDVKPSEIYIKYKS